MCVQEWTKDPGASVEEIRDNMETFWEQGIDFWLNGQWASEIVKENKRRAYAEAYMDRAMIS